MLPQYGWNTIPRQWKALGVNKRDSFGHHIWADIISFPGGGGGV